MVEEVAKDGKKVDLSGCRSISLRQFAQTGSASTGVLKVLSAKFLSAKLHQC